MNENKQPPQPEGEYIEAKATLPLQLSVCLSAKDVKALYDYEQRVRADEREKRDKHAHHMVAEMFELSTPKDMAIELASLDKQLATLKAEYHELLYAVEDKFPDETRHETALRYIHNAEHSTEGSCQELKENQK